MKKLLLSLYIFTGIFPFLQADDDDLIECIANCFSECCENSNCDDCGDCGDCNCDCLNDCDGSCCEALGECIANSLCFVPRRCIDLFQNEEVGNFCSGVKTGFCSVFKAIGDCICFLPRQGYSACTNEEDKCCSCSTPDCSCPSLDCCSCDNCCNDSSSGNRANNTTVIYMENSRYHRDPCPDCCTGSTRSNNNSRSCCSGCCPQNCCSCCKPAQRRQSVVIEHQPHALSPSAPPLSELKREEGIGQMNNFATQPSALSPSAPPLSKLKREESVV